MESFYGGRQGASIVITKRFDVIDRMAEASSDIKKYKFCYCLAKNINGEYVYIIRNNEPICRDKNNWNNYPKYKWILTPKNTKIKHTTAYRSDGDYSNVISFDDKALFSKDELAESMLDCFELGNNSTDIVNYGEYVIINSPIINHPDNGKIFRRGLDHDNDMYGAEYIGQIVGPQGESPEINIESYSEITNPQGFNGKSGNIEMESGKTLDEIQYKYVTVKDEFGNVIGCNIGFKFPQFELEVEGQSISPYENWDTQDSNPDGIYNYKNLVKPDSSACTNNEWTHPFYQKWNIKIPKGIHGKDVENIDIVYTKAKKGAPYYTTSLQNGNPQYLEEEVNIPCDSLYPTKYLGDHNDIYELNNNMCKIKLDDRDFYVPIGYCYGSYLRYKKKSYNESAIGTITYHKICDCNLKPDASDTIINYYNNEDKLTLSDLQSHLMISDSLAQTYQSGVAYNKGDLVTYNGKLYEMKNDISANENSQWNWSNVDKINDEGYLNELKNFVSDGKTLLANAITGKGVTTLASDTFQTMADNIGGILEADSNRGSVSSSVQVVDQSPSPPYTNEISINSEMDFVPGYIPTKGAEGTGKIKLKADHGTVLATDLNDRKLYAVKSVQGGSISARVEIPYNTTTAKVNIKPYVSLSEGYISSVDTLSETNLFLRQSGNSVALAKEETGAITTPYAVCTIDAGSVTPKVVMPAAGSTSKVTISSGADVTAGYISNANTGGTATVYLTRNGNDVYLSSTRDRASGNVDYAKYSIPTETLTVTPSTSAQTKTPTSGRYFSSVKVNAISTLWDYFYAGDLAINNATSPNWKDKDGIEHSGDEDYIYMKYNKTGYIDNTNWWIGRPASDFGDVTANEVLLGKKFTSAAGLKVEGTFGRDGGVNLITSTNGYATGSFYSGELTPFSINLSSASVGKNMIIIIMVSDTIINNQSGFLFDFISIPSKWFDGTSVVGYKTTATATLTLNYNTYQLTITSHNTSPTSCKVYCYGI